MSQLFVADGNFSSRHCRMHGKDFSDCVVYHFNKQNKCASRHNSLAAILREARQGRWGTPVQRRAGDAPEIDDEDVSGLERHNERTGRLFSPSAPFQTQVAIMYARGPDLIPDFKHNVETWDINSASKAATAHSASSVREEVNKAEIRAVQGHLLSDCGNTGKKVIEEILSANNGSSVKVAAKRCGNKEADTYYNEAETSAWRNRVISRHGDWTFNQPEHKKRRSEVGDGTDPLAIIGVDALLSVFSCLDALSLARCGAVSKGWRSLAGGDGLWRPHCDILWENKAHFPCAALGRCLTKIKAYSITVTESKRTKITRKDLCEHAWEFRFKEVAPDYWLSLDPSWQGLAPMQRYFHEDGSQTAGPNDAVWGGHECRYYLIDKTPSEVGSARYVRINHWPMMTVSRTENWGWELSNAIYVYKSVPDFRKLGGLNDLGTANETGGISTNW